MSPGSAGARAASVVDFDAIRRARRRNDLLEGLARAQENNRRAVARLVHSNLLWTRRGARAGRQLLANWERLVEEADRLKRLDLPMIADEALADGVFAVVESLLVKSEKLASRSAELVASR
jgi:hypothetical protein